MALIKCPGCGNQMSDKAPACPHCGMSGQTTGMNYTAPSVTAAKKKTNKTPAIIAAGIAAAAVIGVLLFLLLSGKNTPRQEPVLPSESDTTLITSGEVINNPKARFTVTMTLDCEYNKHINQYPVDIIIDGAAFVTLPHGETKSYKLELEGGSHTIEFRINGKHTISGKDIYDKNDTGTFAVKTINVTENMKIGYNISLTMFDSIKVTESDH